MRILVDASGLAPFVVERDQWRQRLRQLFTDAIPADYDLVTTNWTLYEALSLASRTGHRHATALFTRVTSHGAIVRVDDEVEAEALRRFLTSDDKSASVVDHANALIAFATDCDVILSFDADFLPLASATGLYILR